MYRDDLSLTLAGLSPSAESLARQLEQWEKLKPLFYEQLVDAAERAASIAESTSVTAALAADLSATTRLAADPAAPRTLAGIDGPRADALLGTESMRVFEETAAMAARLHELPKIEAPAALGTLSSAHFEGIHRITEQALREVDWHRIDEVLRGGPEIHEAAADLIGAYADLDFFGQIERSFDFSLDSFPALEVYGHSSLLRSLSHLGGAEPAEAEEDEEQEEREELGQRGRVSLQTLLGSRHPKLMHMWVGARKALNSQNPDRIRQYCASQRQLLLELLRVAAPDHAVKAWSDDAENFWSRNPKNQPTWQARLRFLCAQADRQDYGSFVVVDAESALKIYSLLNKGVHEVQAGFNSRQIGDLRLRADNLLLFVVMLSGEGKN